MRGFARGLFRKGEPRSAEARAKRGDDDEAKIDHSESKAEEPGRRNDADAEDGDDGDQAQLEQLPVLLDRAYDLMAANLFQKAVNRGHVKQNGVDAVFLRKAKGNYVSCPLDPIDRDTWHDVLCVLNVDAGVHMSNDLVQALIDSTRGSDKAWISIDSEIRIQVVDTIIQLRSSRKSQNAAFIRQTRSLFVWSDNAQKVLEDADNLLARMMATVWQGRSATNPRILSTSTFTSSHSLNSDGSTTSGVGKESAESGHQSAEQVDTSDTFDSAREGEDQRASRPIMLFAPVTTSLAIILVFCIIGLSVGILLEEYLTDNKALRFTVLISLPFALAVSLFGQLWQIIGPVSNLRMNSQFYSGVKPTLRPELILPEVTIIMPVYKESLDTVISPTVKSLNEAITTYERQGGSARILVCEDGMQCISLELQEARRDFYDRQGIAWVARPPHSADFERKGRFKKASNMNFAMELSLRVEELMAETEGTDGSIEEVSYKQAFQKTVEQSEGRAWAEGDIRIGELILIVDCDTRVPKDCFLDAANEFDDSPELAILQHESAVLLVAEHYFERGIAFFTERINKAISYCTANGEIAPFVGHNAFLRWSSLQDVSFLDEQGNRKIWSESHVSEDFDLSLRLQLSGYTGRWATYSNGEFKEGVSLTVVDEIGRWQKYAYGCSELLFRPIFRWYRGPISPLAHQFIWSSVPLHSKITVLAYIFSYYAIACGFPLTIINWVIQGLLRDSLDRYYLSSWSIWLSIVVVFTLAGNISGSILAHRRMELGLGHAIILFTKWIPFFFIFFGGISYHLSTALLAHLFGYNMTWAGTVKEVEVSNFFKEIPSILRKFWLLYLICLLGIAGMIVMTMDFIPKGYRILSFVDISPLGLVLGSHFLLPLVLNPWLMKFHF